MQEQDSDIPMPFKLFVPPDLKGMRRAGDKFELPAFVVVENQEFLQRPEVQAELHWFGNARKELTLYVSVCG
jgi:hypothetical protein